MDPHGINIELDKPHFYYGADKPKSEHNCDIQQENKKLIAYNNTLNSQNEEYKKQIVELQNRVEQLKHARKILNDELSRAWGIAGSLRETKKAALERYDRLEQAYEKIVNQFKAVLEENNDLRASCNECVFRVAIGKVGEAIKTKVLSE